MKAQYEREYFKLGGKYAWYDGDKMEHRSASLIADHFKLFIKYGQRTQK
jgi:hypothetical protein